jgi:hypothetical protein
LNKRQKARYLEKYDDKDFKVSNGKLFYNPSDKLNLEVVKPVDRQKRIKEIYDDPKRGLGLGLGAFYNQISMSYLNIQKKLTDAFLRSQGDYQIGRVPRQIINKPITARVPNERWAIDLIDMKAYKSILLNKGMEYIFSAVDYFTGKAFAEGIKNRDNSINKPTLTDAIIKICKKADTYPHIIQCDSEFNKGYFKTWCQNNNIIIAQSTPHTPQSNGKIERMNREIRKKIRAGIIRNNSIQWYPYLQDYIDNINNQQRTKSKLSPNQVWTKGYHPISKITPIESHVPTKNEINHQHDRALELNRFKRT